MKKVLVIAGVTGSGKTKLGIQMAQKYNGEIISADSVAIYENLDIGSAKPTVEEQQHATHHMVDFLKVDANYSVAEFQKDARAIINDIHNRGKLPILVGGTGLYINALINNYEFEFEEGNNNEDFEKYSNEELYEILLNKSPELLREIHVNNRKRLIRALQKKPHSNKGNQPIYDAKILFLQGDREFLYQRIEHRVDKMIDSGLVEEIEVLLKVHPDFFEYQSTQSIGYREFKDYFNSNQSLEETIELIKRNTRRFAKRQITWFKNKVDCEWINIEDMSNIPRIVEEWLNANDNFLGNKKGTE